MLSSSAKLDRRTKQHNQFGVSASNGSRDVARTKSWRKKKKEKKKKEEEKKMNLSKPIQHPLRGSINYKRLQIHVHKYTDTGIHVHVNTPKIFFSYQ